MMGLNLLPFDQTSLLFFVLSALGLIRERRVLPFLIVMVGNLFTGSLFVPLLAALILWTRMDARASKWVQLKDAFGFFLILVGTLAPEPYQQFASFFGVLFLSFSFGVGGLGIIPALLLLRQYIPHPNPIEVVIIGASVYWLTVEVTLWWKIKQANLITSSIEVVCSCLILFETKDLALRAIEEPILLILGALILFTVFVLSAWLRWNGDGFWSFYRRVKLALSHSLVAGRRFISDEELWCLEPKEEGFPEIEASFNRFFIMTLISLILLSGFVLFSRGGFN